MIIPACAAVCNMSPLGYVQVFFLSSVGTGRIQTEVGQPDRTLRALVDLLMDENEKRCGRASKSFDRRWNLALRWVAGLQILGHRPPAADLPPCSRRLAAACYWLSLDFPGVTTRVFGTLPCTLDFRTPVGHRHPEVPQAPRIVTPS